MANDYSRDIVPPEDPGFDDKEQQIPIRVNESPAAPAPSRGIRNISVPDRTRPTYPGGPPQRVGDDMRGVPHEAMPPRPHRRSSRLWIWILAALSLAVIGGLALLAFRPTSVTVTPKSRVLTFTDSMIFVAQPGATASDTSVLTYTVHTSELEDSEVVPSQGTTHVETKASGSITVYNNYSSAPVRLIKNTRFETPEGFIFRTPADIVIPGKSSVPGQIKITVFADQAGEKYNVGPVSRFNLPGLKSGPMYAGVYAKSTTAMAGGFVGEQPATAPGALNAAIATVRARLEAKAREGAKREEEGVIAFPDLATIAFQSLPHTIEAGTGVRIHEKAIIDIPLVSEDALGIAIARSVAEDDAGPLTFTPGETLVAHQTTSSAPTLGLDSLTFSFTGTGTLIWNVDAGALASALAGRDSVGFQTIVNTFSGIQEAHARIEPFWKKTFPADPGDIKIKVVEPEAK